MEFFLQHLDLFKHTNTVFYLTGVDSCASRRWVLCVKGHQRDVNWKFRIIQVTT